jgi:two-component system response regulator VicR
MDERCVLIIEDEQAIVDILKFNFQKEGYKVLEAMDGQTGLELALSENPDLILLDVMLPRMDGFEVCKKIREKSSVPVIMLTAREEEVDKVLGLELGADDYMTKPFSIRELTARVKANLRRTSIDRASVGQDNASLITSGDLTINVERYEVSKYGKVIDITLREFELLKFLATQPERIFSRENLLENVWGYEYYGDVRTVDVTVRRLREKIEDDPGMPRYIITKRGVGYYFNKAQ